MWKVVITKYDAYSSVFKTSLQHFLQWHNDSINYLIEQAILEADKKGIKVFSLGLMNQGEELNSYGGLYVRRHPQLKIKIVDGCSLAAAVVLNSIPKGTTQVLLRGKITKVATLHEEEYMKLNKALDKKSESSLILSKTYAQKVNHQIFKPMLNYS
uniref:Uncharacterized protein n=1 Tax=Quercus lobata TaxID=97700 RepID=A0A7N2LEJ4_QUELO